MKKINYINLAAMIMVCVIGFSCDKHMDTIREETFDLNNKAQVQLVVASPNATRNYLYVDSKQVTGATLGSGSIFPASSTGVSFAVDPGLRSFLLRDTAAAATQMALNFAENLDAGKRYSIFIYDTLNALKQKTVRDEIIIPAGDSSARIRFANFVYNPTALPGFDIYSARRQANIFTNVQVTEVTPFIDIKAGLPDTLYIRTNGSTTNLQNVGVVPPDIRVIVTPTPTRSYTLLFRGSYRTATTSSLSRTLQLISH
jgi:hypothetical protein